MSGFKRATVTISQEDYRRLHDADMQKRFKRKKKSPDRQRSHQFEALKNAYRQVESRQEHYEQVLGNLDDEIRELESQAAQHLITAQAAFYENVIAEINRSAEETEISLTALLDRMQEDIQRERMEYQQNLRECVAQLKESHLAHENKHALADFWITQTDALYDFINQEFDTNHFVPGRLEKTAQRLDLARMNLGYGMPESALPTAQTAYLELSDLRVELEAMTLEWQNLFAYAYSALQELNAAIITNAQIPALDTEGRELPILIDVNLWSLRKHKTLHNECRGWYRRLSKHHDEVRIEELRQIIDKELPRIWHELDTLIYEARLSALQSQIRANIAELALQALATQGFALVEAGYEGDDPKRAYDARLLNRADGIAVEVKVAPKPGENYANDIIVISEDATLKTEHELRTRFDEIRSAFARYGLSVGATQTIPNSPRTTPTNGSVITVDKRRPHQTRIEKDVRAD